jgi:putative SOS response-associated peptidase YedK
MCERYYRGSDQQYIAEAFHIAAKLPAAFLLPKSDYNVMGGTFQPVIRNNQESGSRELVLMHWGMVPHFAKSLPDSKANTTINAMSEDLMTTAMWKASFKRRRCLIPADGFYEWQRLDSKATTPHAFSLRNGALLAFAGIWDEYKHPTLEQSRHNFAIVTTTSNEVVAPFHERMPVVIQPQDYDRWLHKADLEPPPEYLLKQYPAEEMIAREVHNDVRWSQGTILCHGHAG